ncbi:polysaccharide lyase family 14 protein [Mycena galericulata]|nr:polysaccharide lyase family 14 protein [Mycena galericulata]
MELSHLIPVDTFQSGFTACPSLILPKIDAAALEDEDLGVHKVTSRTSHPLVTPPAEASHSNSTDWPAPSRAWEAFYPKGSINPSAPMPGGFGFYLSGPPTFASRLESGATHVVLSYRMMLQSEWEWVKGGKLPGIFGGEGDLSYSCTGGRQDHRCKCFNIRPMWRSKGHGELYTYLPLTPTNRERLLAVPPSSKENSDYGFSVGRNAFQFSLAVGKWISLAFRVKLNAVGSEDGELELWVDGKSVINVSGLTFRDSEQSRIKGCHFQTFFGGHTDDWASPKDQRAWFADLSGVIIE